MDFSISIILCCYNSEIFLRETLESIKNQTYTNYELIIVDDGSTDNTNSILKNFILLNKQLNIKLLTQKNNGLPSSRNLAILNSSFKWISIIDHDDLWEKNKLEEQISQIKKNKNCNLFFSDFKVSSSYNSRFSIARNEENYNPHELNMGKKNGFINLAIKGCFIGSSTVTFNKKIIKNIGYFDKKYIFLTDYIFFLKVAEKYDMYCSNKILTIWREHQTQSTKLLHNIYIKEMNKLYKSFYSNKNLYLKHKIIIFRNQIIFNVKNFIKNLKKL